MTVPTTVEAEINYTRRTDKRPRFYANDLSRNEIALDPRVMPIADARNRPIAPTLGREGFALYDCPTEVKDFRDPVDVGRFYAAEIERLILGITGADAVVVTGPPTLRFAERSAEAGTRNNSRAARFIHIDCSDSASAHFARQSAPAGRGMPRRVAQHNIWRTFSGAPQDVPLAVCDARSLAPTDLVPADAIFDLPNVPDEQFWSFEALLLHFNPDHRWHFYSDMIPDEVLVFTRNDTDPAVAHHVPHSAFTDSRIPSTVAPRASVEMRTIAYWF